MSTIISRYSAFVLAITIAGIIVGATVGLRIFSGTGTKGAVVREPISVCVDTIQGPRAQVSTLAETIRLAEPYVIERHTQFMERYESTDGIDRPWPGLNLQDSCPGGVVFPVIVPFNERTRPLDAFIIKEAVSEIPVIRARLAVAPADLPGLSGQPFIRVPYEATCEPQGYPCNEASTAVYISEAYIADVEVVTRAVNAAMGFGLSPDSRPDDYEVPPPPGKTVVE